MKKKDLNKLLHNSRPQIFEHSSAKRLQVFQIGFSTHNTSPLRRVTGRENREKFRNVYLYVIHMYLKSCRHRLR